MRNVIKTAPVSNLGFRKISCRQKILCGVDAAIKNIAHGRFSDDPFEMSVKGGTLGFAYLHNGINGYLFGIVRMDVLQRFDYSAVVCAGVVLF